MHDEVSTWMDMHSEDHWERVVVVIDRLSVFGSSARMPMARNRLDTLARVATALNRHLVVSFPAKVPSKLKDAVQVA